MKRTTQQLGLALLGTALVTMPVVASAAPFDPFPDKPSDPVQVIEQYEWLFEEDEFRGGTNPISTNPTVQFDYDAFGNIHVKLGHLGHFKTYRAIIGLFDASGDFTPVYYDNFHTPVGKERTYIFKDRGDQMETYGPYTVKVMLKAGSFNESELHTWTVPERPPLTLAHMIQSLRDRDVVSGYPDGSYREHEKMERVHVALMLHRALDLQPIHEAKTFKDVPESYRGFEAIRALQRAGVVDGSKSGHFHPTDPVTRAQMAKMMVTAFGLKTKGEAPRFEDVPDGHWAKSYIDALRTNDITLGVDETHFDPDGTVTRGQYARFLYRALER